MSHKQLGILSALALLMTLLSVFDPWARDTERKTPRLLGSYDVADLTRISLAEGAATYEAKRQADGSWVTTFPEPGAAESNTRIRMRSSLQLLRSMRRSKEQGAYGTNNSGQVLTLVFDASESVVLQIGAKTANGKSRWIRKGDSRFAHLVESHLVAEILDDAKSLRSPLLVPWTLLLNEPLRISSQNRWMEIAGSSLRWSREDGTVASAVADSSLTQHWLESLALLAESDGETCEHPPEMRIEQGALTVKTLPSLCLDPESLAVVLTGIAHPDRLANMHLLPSRYPQQDFLIRCGDSERRVQIGQVDQKSLRSWWSGWDTAPREIAAKRDFEAHCSLHFSDLEVAIGKRDGMWVATSPHDNYDFVLAPEGLPGLSPVSELFLSPLLITEDAAFLRRVEFSGAAGRRVLTRDRQSGSWNLRGAELSQSQIADWVTLLGRTLGTLHAKRFTSEHLESPAAKSRLKLTVDFESALSDTTNRYHIELAGSAESCTALVGERPPALLAPEDCAVLLRLDTP